MKDKCISRTYTRLLNGDLRKKSTLRLPSFVKAFIAYITLVIQSLEQRKSYGLSISFILKEVCP